MALDSVFQTHWIDMHEPLGHNRHYLSCIARTLVKYAGRAGARPAVGLNRELFLEKTVKYI